jgi:hypothetical protein
VIESGLLFFCAKRFPGSTSGSSVRAEASLGDGIQRALVERRFHCFVRQVDHRAGFSLFHR